MRILALIIAFIVPTAMATSNYHQVVTTSLGMVSVNITENASTLSAAAGSTESNTASEAQSATASVISGDVTYEFLNYATKSYFIRAVAPLLSSDGAGFFLGGLGMNFYMNSLSSMFTFSDAGTSLTMNPTMRFYWGPSAGIGFVVYNTTTAKKSDLIFDIELHGGGVLNFKRDYGLRGEAGISRGTGVSSSTIGFKVFVGLSYYLE
ncbi:MAG: hypothetical protein A2X86_05280 [Bdellovibrionales bacterium GWA2_49_15]|nr:MAG: hypothetical protein A2X86_05280 [Bdellovibrionales bacterium GWA2_49_15]